MELYRGRRVIDDRGAAGHARLYVVPDTSLSVERG